MNHYHIIHVVRTNSQLLSTTLLDSELEFQTGSNWRAQVDVDTCMQREKYVYIHLYYTPSSKFDVDNSREKRREPPPELDVAKNPRKSRLAQAISHTAF